MRLSFILRTTIRYFYFVFNLFNQDFHIFSIIIQLDIFQFLLILQNRLFTIKCDSNFHSNSPILLCRKSYSSFNVSNSGVNFFTILFLRPFHVMKFNIISQLFHHLHKNVIDYSIFLLDYAIYI